MAVVDQEADFRASREHKVIPPSASCASKSFIGGSLAARQSVYQDSVENPSSFWAKHAAAFHWSHTWNQVLRYNFDSREGPIFQEWFEGGFTNVCYNCLDRHLPHNKDRVAYFWEGNELGEEATLTYGQLFDAVTKLAGVLRSQYGVTKGTRVSLYLPMITLAPVAMLALARLGAVVCVVFGGFSAESLSSRLVDSQSTLLITAESTMRGDKQIKLKQIVDDALNLAAKEGLADCKCLVFERHSRATVKMTPGRDAWFADVMKGAVPETAVTWVEAEHPLFILYTSGSTGKPKGLVHTTGGYMVYAGLTHQYVFDYHPEDVYFCTADVGWVTGHTYVVYGPLLNAATSVIFEGVPTYPTPSRWWQIVDKYRVSIFYTAPTAIRSLMISGDAPVKASSRASLRVLGTVGEPINAEAWNWYYKVVGNSNCDIIDTWWQTETGGVMITPIPGTTPLKPGCATLPFFGVQPAVLDTKTLAEFPTGKPAEGFLCIKHPWPAQARTIFNDHARYQSVYFEYPGYYFTGDGCRRDEDGYYWLTGRVDDVLNVSGHRLGTAEIEDAINRHPSVVESAVVGVPHEIKGEGIYAFVSFKQDVTINQELLTSVRAIVRTIIGPLAVPDVLHPAPGLPKTRSGKIMRRILRKIAMKELGSLGDISTLADPNVVQQLLESGAKWVPAAKM